MKSHAQKQSELICVVSMGLVGVTLVLAHAFAAFSPVFDGDYFEIENRSFVAGPVTILELAWSGFALITASAATRRTGPAILAGLVALAASLFVLLVGGGARNWMAGTLLVFLMFWGAVVLELYLGFVHGLVADATASPSSRAGPRRWTLLSTPRAVESAVQGSMVPAAATTADNVQSPPPYEPPMPGEQASIPLQPLRGALGGYPKTTENV